MKKLILIILLFSAFAQAQESMPNPRKNEVRVDVLQAVLSSKVSLSYERFLNTDFSVGFNVNFSGSSKIKNDFDEGYVNNLPQYEFNPYVRYALSKGKKSYYFAEVFGSYNGGEYKEIVYKIDENLNGYYDTQKSKYTDFGAGGALGYKMYFSDSFGMELLVGFGYNFVNTDKSPDKISRVGLNLGYRF
ncbi:DUF3575 domain-containing protein [Flavobacterium sp.]